MVPTLAQDDWVIYRVPKTLNTLINQVVVCEHPYTQSLIIKRVQEQSDKAVFLVGDCPEASTDSRSFGMVPLRKVRGIVCSYRARSTG